MTTIVTHTDRQTGKLEFFSVSGVNPKHVAELIANATHQTAIWTGKVRGEWHITDKKTRKVTAIVYAGT